MQQHRELAVRFRPVNVGAQNDAIAHRDGHAAFRRYLVGFGGLQHRRGEEQAESNAHTAPFLQSMEQSPEFKEYIRYQFLPRLGT